MSAKPKRIVRSEIAQLRAELAQLNTDYRQVCECRTKSVFAYNDLEKVNVQLRIELAKLLDVVGTCEPCIIADITKLNTQLAEARKVIEYYIGNGQSYKLGSAWLEKHPEEKK
jgi:hypothetical protein